MRSSPYLTPPFGIFLPPSQNVCINPDDLFYKGGVKGAFTTPPTPGLDLTYPVFGIWLYKLYCCGSFTLLMDKYQAAETRYCKVGNQMMIYCIYAQLHISRDCLCLSLHYLNVFRDSYRIRQKN